ncbi:rod-binding protein [Loktanella salsilacus]|uniref:rod-binding protein n=1 Tax=Loktanella salsilacus TaxID=195913 RepID=UPI0037360478
MTPMPAIPAAVPPQARNGPITSDEKLMAAAQQLEATFLSEMLKAAGFDAANGAFGGGNGEDGFASFLRDAHAENIIASGGIGLAESLFHAIKVRAYV